MLTPYVTVIAIASSTKDILRMKGSLVSSGQNTFAKQTGSSAGVVSPVWVNVSLAPSSTRLHFLKSILIRLGASDAVCVGQHVQTMPLPLFQEAKCQRQPIFG